MIREPYWQTDRATLWHGDCLDVLRTLADASVDAVVTDPPYMIGAISVSNTNAKCGTWADMENSAYWFSAWFSECRRIMKPTGYMVVFTNWRSIPTIIRALSIAKCSASSCMVWDKKWIGPAGPQQLRPRYEMVVFSAMPDAGIDDRSAADVVECKWMAGNMRETEHPAEKPVELLRYLCRLVVPPDGVVVDPFTGSGTTGKAALAEGFRFIGIEREAEYLTIAKARIAKATEDGPGLFGGVA